MSRLSVLPAYTIRNRHTNYCNNSTKRTFLTTAMPVESRICYNQGVPTAHIASLRKALRHNASFHKAARHNASFRKTASRISPSCGRLPLKQVWMQRKSRVFRFSSPDSRKGKIFQMDTIVQKFNGISSTEIKPAGKCDRGKEKMGMRPGYQYCLTRRKESQWMQQ